MVRIYKFKQFQVYSNYHNGFIIHNTLKPFSDGHTHLNNFDTAKFLIKLSFHKRVPNHLSLYLIDSLIRISTDQHYIKSLEILKEKQKQKRK